MLRQCNGTDPTLSGKDGESPCDCGSVFDDVDYMVIWPHRAVHNLRAPLIDAKSVPHPYRSRSWPDSGPCWFCYMPESAEVHQK